MILEHKICLSKSSGHDSIGNTQTNIKIPLSLKSIPVDNTESAEYDFVNEQSILAINNIDDYEKIRFVPFSSITEIQYHLKDKLGNPISYDFFGISNDDLKFQRNRFKNSFLRLNFFDSSNPTNQRLAFQQQLFNQINSFNRDGNNNLLDVSTSPIVYRITDPIFTRGQISEGFYIYWLKTLMNNENYPLNFYMYASYANAVDGKNTQLVSYQPTFNINEYNTINYVKYVLSTFDGLNLFRPINVNRQISIISQNILKIDLNIPNII